ncbi:MAG TPA: toprim domain-containing protein [Ilumatobacteraceae bacterium]|nr:toprim domain-containing protein [Ilumatobacteraceae bacterium]
MTGEQRPRWRIEDVLNRTDLDRLLDELAVPATHQIRGRRWHCPLPNHDDQHPSVTVHVDHRGHERWRCWSGDDSHRGDAIDLVALTQHVPKGEAVDWLARRAGMTPDKPLPPIRRKPKPTAARAVPLNPIVVEYATACERILWSGGGRQVREWLHGRGFDDELLSANHIGADPGRQMLRRRRGLPYGATVGAVFPALDPAGRIRYLQTRYLEPGRGPKYDNPAASLGSNPRVAWTRPTHAPQTNVLVICEGIPDALTAAGAGLRSVAVLGSQAPDQSVASRIASYADKYELHAVAVVDNDDPGRAWGERLTGLLAEHGVEPDVIEPPNPGCDLNAWAASEPEWTSQLLSEREPARAPVPVRPQARGLTV